MYILVISSEFPRPDRASGDLRFETIMGLLAQEHEVALCVANVGAQERKFGHIEVQRCRERLIGKGIRMIEGQFEGALRGQRWDILFFEFYHAALGRLDRARYLQPDARIVVDSVDVHFRRFDAKARLTQKREDAEEARRIRKEELDTYSRVDLVIAVTEEDKTSLGKVLPMVPAAIVPNVHEMKNPERIQKKEPGTLIFVGGFQHGPNLDAMLYFCESILPLIERQVPEVRLRIVGQNPPASLRAFASERVEVLGYVQDTEPLFERTRVAVAPLRYGAGMKGKIGEAMAFGLPVVTTSVGVEGFGLTPGRDVLVGDTPEEFAANVVQLLEDDTVYDSVRWSGWRFINERYSVDAVRSRLVDVIDEIKQLRPSKVSAARRMFLGAKDVYERNIGWRFRKGRAQQ